MTYPVISPQTSADYIESLRRKPSLDDDYSSKIEDLREGGFSECPFSGIPLDNIANLLPEAKKAYLLSRYYDRLEFEQPLGSPERETARVDAAAARVTRDEAIQRQGAAVVRDLEFTNDQSGNTSTSGVAVTNSAVRLCQIYHRHRCRHRCRHRRRRHCRHRHRRCRHCRRRYCHCCCSCC